MLSFVKKKLFALVSLASGPILTNLASRPEHELKRPKFSGGKVGGCKGGGQIRKVQVRGGQLLGKGEVTEQKVL